MSAANSHKRAYMKKEILGMMTNKKIGERHCVMRKEKKKIFRSHSPQKVIITVNDCFFSPLPLSLSLVFLPCVCDFISVVSVSCLLYIFLVFLWDKQNNHYHAESWLIKITHKLNFIAFWFDLLGTLLSGERTLLQMSFFFAWPYLFNCNGVES